MDLRSDDKIRQDVVRSIKRDARVESSGLTIEVSDGVVTLTGTVPTYTAMWAAYDDAQFVNGVVRVVNILKVLFPPDYVVPSDKELQNSAENVLAWSADLDSTRIGVSAHEGAMTLEGYVPWYWHRGRAEELVSGLRGVTEVQNKIVVVPTQEIADELIAEDIIGELERLRLLDDSKIRVGVKDGAVTLAGEVGITLSSWRAERAARNALGVKDVDSRLSVKYL